MFGPIDKAKEDILKNYDRLILKDTFKFNCHSKVPCFNDCCSDVNIFLTPYDIIRMKNRLDMHSDDFLDKYTLAPFNKEQKIPVIVLKMEDDEKTPCPFVTEQGCGIYEDRPWACRMFPLGLASPKEQKEDTQKHEEFYFLLKEDVCKGYDEDRVISVAQWIDEQGIEDYNKMGEFFKAVTLHPYLAKGDLNPQKVDMFYNAAYNIDEFRRFILQSSFFQRFEMGDHMEDVVKTRNLENDIELYKFAMRWLMFSLFGEKVIEIKREYINKAKQKL